MAEGLKKLYSGDFNSMLQERQSDGSIVITLSKDNENKTYKFRVKDLYGDNEEVLEEEIIETKISKHIKGRMDVAKKWREEKGKR